jgi:hypothetical protein
MRYFEVNDDNLRFPDRWFLDEPLTKTGEPIDGRDFVHGQPYLGPVPVHMPIQQEGRRVPFSLAAFDMPVVTQEIAQLVDQIAPGEVEIFPVTIASSVAGYSILNVIHREACVDESRSEILRWKPEDGRPDKVGRYRMLSDLTVDPAKTKNRHIFRVEDYVIILIVSERLKTALEQINDLGIVFRPVC